MIISILLSILSLAGCSHIWTYTFVLHEGSLKADLKNWQLEPDIFSVKNIIADSDSLLPKDDYIISLIFKNDRKTEIFYDVSLDTIRLSFFGKLNDTLLVVKEAYYYSLPSNKSMKKNFDFIPISDIEDIEKTNIPELFIPDDIDSLLLTASVFLYEGEYISYYPEIWNSKIECDSVGAIDGRAPIEVPVKVVLYKYREKGKAVSLFSDR